MSDYRSSSLSRSLPLATVDRLRSLWQETAQNLGREVIFLTEDILSEVTVDLETAEKSFIVLISDRFSALLVETGRDKQTEELLTPNVIDVRLTFEPEEITSFLLQIANQSQNSEIATTLEQVCLKIKPNDLTIQSQFTLNLIEILANNSESNDELETSYPYVSVCQPIEDALRQQVEQERLLNQVTTQIRQSLELPVILTTAVEQVREFLQADRLVIYQFTDRMSRPAIAPEATTEIESSSRSLTTENDRLLNEIGEIIYESRANDSIPSVLGFKEGQECFIDVPNLREKYRHGFTQAVSDVETTYRLFPCFLELMQQVRVRAKLIVPLIVESQLWGLSIAHQCQEPRQWKDSEKKFLQHISEHLAIAIYQAKLYAELQEQKQNLERRAIERTQELRDALVMAESANRAKSEFLATMSHELKSPLTSIIGLSATLLRWQLAELPPKYQDYLQIIHDRGKHLLATIDDILDLSQLEAGKIILNVSECSLREIADRTLQTFQKQAASRQINLTVDFPVILGSDRLRFDPQRLAQILWNLVSNAIKFTPAGGQVILRVWVESNTAVFQVEDTGIGISQEQRSLLFQKFQQLDSSRQRQYEGTGLGLALTKQLVELHKGKIEVESAVGVGSTFTVWLPSQ
jgi:signal transduction histidine kinase